MAVGNSIRLAAAFVEVSLDKSKLLKGLRGIGSDLQRTGASILRIGSSIAGAGAAILVPLGLASRKFAEFDDEIRKLRAVSGAERAIKSLTQQLSELNKVAGGSGSLNVNASFSLNTSDVEAELGSAETAVVDLEKLIRQLGRSTSFTATEVAQAASELARAGFNIGIGDTQPEIQQSLQSVLDLSRATSTDLPLAAQIAASTLRAFQLEASDMTKTVDELVATVNNSAQRLEDLGESLKLAGDPARRAGLSIAETSASIAILADRGIRGSLAGNALKRSIEQLATTKTQDLLRDKLGINVKDVDGAFKQIPKLLAEIFRESERLGKVSQQSFLLDLFGARASAAAPNIGANIDAFDNLIAKIESANGIARSTADTMDSGLGGAFRLVKSAVDDVVISIGKAFAQDLLAARDAVIDFVNEVGAWVEANEELIRVAGRAGASLLAIGVPLVILGGTISIIGSSISGLASIFGLIAAPLKIASGLITVMATAFSGIVSVGSAVAGSFGTIAAAASGVVTVASSIVTTIAGLFSSGAIISAVTGFISVIYSIGAAIAGLFSASGLAAIGAVLTAAWSAASAAAVSFIAAALPVIGTMVAIGAAVAIVGAAFIAFGDEIKAVFDYIFKGLGALVSLIGNVLKGIASFTGITNIVTGLVKSFEGVFESLKTLILAGEIKSAFEVLWGRIRLAAFQAFNDLVAGVLKILASIPRALLATLEATGISDALGLEIDLQSFDKALESMVSAKTGVDALAESQRRLEAQLVANVKSAARLAEEEKRAATIAEKRSTDGRKRIKTLKELENQIAEEIQMQSVLASEQAAYSAAEKEAADARRKFHKEFGELTSKSIKSIDQQIEAERKAAEGSKKNARDRADAIQKAAQKELDELKNRIATEGILAEDLKRTASTATTAPERQAADNSLQESEKRKQLLLDEFKERSRGFAEQANASVKQAKVDSDAHKERLSILEKERSAAENAAAKVAFGGDYDLIFDRAIAKLEGDLASTNEKIRLDAEFSEAQLKRESEKLQKPITDRVEALKKLKDEQKDLEKDLAASSDSGEQTRIQAEINAIKDKIQLEENSIEDRRKQVQAEINDIQTKKSDQREADKESVDSLKNQIKEQKKLRDEDTRRREELQRFEQTNNPALAFKDAQKELAKFREQGADSSALGRAEASNIDDLLSEASDGENNPEKRFRAQLERLKELRDGEFGEVSGQAIADAQNRAAKEFEKSVDTSGVGEVISATASSSAQASRTQGFVVSGVTDERKRQIAILEQNKRTAIATAKMSKVLTTLGSG